MAATTSAAMEQTPLLGDATARPPKQKIILRPAHLSDLSIMAEHSKDAYWHGTVTKWLAPKAEEHPEDMVRFMRQGMQKRFAKANSLSLVACIPAQDGAGERVVGCAQFSREGSDPGAERFVREKGWAVRAGLWSLRWWFWAEALAANAIWPDRVMDQRNARMFGEWGQVDEEKYWATHPERHDRWHAAVVVVSPEYQGKGIGRLLMAHVIEKAELERVPMGLIASQEGEYLYKKLGFQLLGEFSHRVPNTEGGGIMIYYPPSFEGKRHDG